MANAQTIAELNVTLTGDASGLQRMAGEAGKAMDQWTREIPVVAERGLVTDRNGEILADNTTAFTVFARSNAVKNVESTAKSLADALEMPYEEIYKKVKVEVIQG